MTPWHELPPHIKITYQSQAQYESRVRSSMKFRKKPVVIEAAQWFKNGDASHAPITPMDNDHPETKCLGCGKPWDDHANCKTLEGFHVVCPGDWIITGIHGEHYPCKPDIFEKTYERVD